MKKILTIFAGILLCAIVQGQVIQLRKPLGGLVWPGYSIQSIEWTSENVDNVKIESSLDSGRTWILIIGSYPASAQRYDWQVPNKPSDSCFIRVTDISNATVSSSNYKNNPFRIPMPGIELDDMPAIVTGGTIQPITWNSSGIRKVNLYVSYDNKTSYQKLADTVVASLGYYNWRVPDTYIGNSCWIKIEDAENTGLSHIISVAFQINRLTSLTSQKYKGGSFDGSASANNKTRIITFTKPVAVDSAFAGETLLITWKQNNSDQVKLLFSADGGSNWVTVAQNIAASSGKFEWVVTGPVTNQGYFKIIDQQDSTVSATSSVPFIIRKKSLALSYPASTGQVYKNTVLPVLWNSGGVQYVSVRLLYQGRDSLLLDSVPASIEASNWVIPQNMSGSFRIRIVDRNDPATADTSNLLYIDVLPTAAVNKYRGGSFDGHTMLSNEKSILQLLLPKANDSISVSSKYQIKWKSYNIERIGIYFSTDDGNSWTLIAKDVASNSETFTWQTPIITGSNYRLRIHDMGDSSVKSISGKFVLIPKKLQQTTDSLNWVKGSIKLIEWISGGVDSIQIEHRFSTSGAWTKWKDRVPATSEGIAWAIPENMGDSLQIRVSDAADPGLQDIRTFTGFKKLPQQTAAQKYRGGAFDGHSQRSNINKIIVQKPVENEVLVSGTIYTIKWSTVNLQDSILLQFSVDSGATWTTIASTLASNGQYEWRIPVTLSTSEREGNIVIGSNSVNQTGIKQVTSTSSSKCLIRALDTGSGNLIVGISSKPFTITGNDSTKKAITSFAAIADTSFAGSTLRLFVKATTNSGNPLKYFITPTATASIAGDTLLIIAPGSITVAAYTATGNGYQASDTIYRTFCVRPPKPSINFSGAASICTNDSLTLNATIPMGNPQWYRNDTAIANANTNQLVVKQTGTYLLKVSMNSCTAVSNMVSVSNTPRPAKPVISIVSGNIVSCAGDSLLLTSQADSGYWFRDGNLIGNNSSKQLLVNQSGRYTMVSGLQGCTSDTSNAIIATIHPRPDSLPMQVFEYCQGITPVQLSVSKPAGQTILWYTQLLGGSGSETAPTVNTNLAGTIIYYVSPKSLVTGCEGKRTTVTVYVKPAPQQPVITRRGDSLITTPASQYIWHLNNQPILGGIGMIQPIIAKGIYRVSVKKDSSCWSNSALYYVQSDPQVMVNQAGYKAIVYPNPSNGAFFLQIDLEKRYSGFADLSIVNSAGLTIWTGRKFIFNDSKVRIPINTTLPTGVNTVTIRLNGYAVKTLQLIGL